MVATARRSRPGQHRCGGAQQLLKLVVYQISSLSIRIPGERADEERVRAVVCAELGEQAFALALAEGREMTPQQALAPPGQHIVLASHTSRKCRGWETQTASFPFPLKMT